MNVVEEEQLRVLYLTTYDPARSDLGGASWVDRRILDQVPDGVTVDVVEVLQPAGHVRRVPVSVQDSRVNQTRVLLRIARRREAYQEAKFRFHRGWLEAVQHVRYMIADGGYDLLVTSQWPALLMAEDADVWPDLHIAHNVDTVIAQRYDPAALRLFRNAARTEGAERRLLSRAGHVLALSRSDVLRLREWGIDAEHLSLVGQEPGPRPVERPRRNGIGFIGNLRWPPNATALRALMDDVMPEVGRREPALRDALQVVLAGRGSEALAGPGVEALGVIDDVRTFYDRVDAVVVPRTGPSTGVSVKMLEALERGVDVVAPRALLDDAGVVHGAWPGDTPEEMAGQIIEFFSHRSTPLPEDRPAGAVPVTTFGPALMAAAKTGRRRGQRAPDGTRGRFVRDCAELHAVVFDGPRPVRVQTVNLQHLQLASVHSGFRSALAGADRLTADGWPVQLMLWRRGVRVERVTGSGFLHDAVRSGALAGRRVALLGAAESTGIAFQEIVEDAGGHLVLREHGWWSEWDADLLVEEIGEARAEIVFVAVTPPAGELVAHALRQRGLRAAIIGVGGSVDMLTGVKRLVPSPLGRLGLEWLFRFVQEPRRLFRRYFLEGVPFLVRALMTNTPVHGIDDIRA
ncbi:WecB/TagA/CpsF family glycosyltransferase [Geodermatophilus sp. SYSU D00705]